MKVSGLGRYPFCVSIGVAMLAGCGGSQPPIGAPGALSQRLTDSNLRSQSDGYEVRPPLLYVANFSSGNYGSITVYHATGKDPSPIATITDGISSPGGVCIDRLGILYVENETQGGAGWISEYRLGKTKPSHERRTQQCRRVSRGSKKTENDIEEGYNKSHGHRDRPFREYLCQQPANFKWFKYRSVRSKR
jgi:hypothetical protein